MKRLFAAAMIAALSAVAPANALVVYSGADNAVSSLAQMTNSIAAAAAFDAATAGSGMISFETALPSGVSIIGGTTTNNSGCGTLCGFNTTAAGSQFRNLFGGSVTFSFASAINSFGMYITGLQTDLVPQETLTFSDGSTQVINVPTATSGGGAFLGFTSFGNSIVSVTYNATNDVVSLDDVRFGNISAVPELSTWAMIMFGFAGVGFMGYRRSRKQCDLLALRAA